MGDKALSCKTIGQLSGGSAELIVDRAIAQAVADVDDRGDDEQARKVAIEIVIVKKEGLTVASVTAHAKLPPWKTGNTIAKTRFKQGQPSLMFQPDCPENPDQNTFLDVAGGEVPNEE